MNVFYCPEAVLNEDCTLDEVESGHITRVLRKREGEELYIFDGKGGLFDARIVSIGKRTVNIHIARLVKLEDDNGPRLHMAIALPKNIERFEWFVEKATEIGIAEITPLICQHSERRELRLDRIEKILVSACKQSLHLRLPRVNEPVKLDEFVVGIDRDVRKYIAYCEDGAIYFKDAYHGGFDAVVMIGPEGDFSKEEVLLAVANEFEIVSLGQSRLRLETAGLYSVTAFNLVNERTKGE